MKCVLDWESKALTGIDGLCQNSQLFHFQTNINNENPATSARQINSCKTLTKKNLGIFIEFKGSDKYKYILMTT